jgi:hypothetical protein
MRPLAAIVIGATMLDAGCQDRADPRPSAAVERTMQDGAVWVVMRLDRATLTTADSLVLTLEVTAPATAGAVPPVLPPDFGEFTVVEQWVGGVKLAEGDRLTSTAVYTLESFLPGPYTIPPIEVGYTGDAGVRRSIVTEPVGVEVESVLGAEENEAALAPPRDVVDPEPPSRMGLRVMAAGLALSATGCGFGAWMILRPRNRQAADPCSKAQKRLVEAQAAPMPDAGATRAAVAEASRLVRECLADRVDPAATTWTTEELLSQPAISGRLSPSDLTALRSGLARADAAKFAQANLSEEEARAALAEALGLVRSLAAHAGGKA